MEGARELLTREYFWLQELVEKFDARALQIKGWSVTVSLAGMTAALLNDKIDDGTRALAFAIAALAALAFWWIEFSWKLFQWSFFNRLATIEAAFRKGDEGVAAVTPLQTRTSFQASIAAMAKRRGREAFRVHVMLPHAPIAVLGGVLACIWGAR